MFQNLSRSCTSVASLLSLSWNSFYKTPSRGIGTRSFGLHGALAEPTLILISVLFLPKV